MWALAWPAVALNSLQVINTLLDRFFIGHLESAALTAQGASQNVLFLMFSLAMAIGTAATAIVARAYGAEDRAGYRMGAQQSANVTLQAGIVLAAISALIAPAASKLILPDDPRSVHLMTEFLLAYSAGLPAIYMIQTLAGALRGIGDTKSPMVISGIQILLHIILNFLLIFPSRTFLGIHVPGANMGLTGASTALSISAWISALIYIGYTGRTPLGTLWRFHLPPRNWVARILKIAFPAATMAILRVLSLTAFTLVLALVPHGEDAIAGMSIAFALESIMFMPAFGLSIAAGALVGQSLGMKRSDRAEKLAWIASHYAGLVTVVLALPIFFLAHPIALYLVDGKEAIAGQASVLLRYLCSTEVMFAYAMVLIGAMQGAGDTVRPMWISIIAMWGLRVPIALFASLGAGTHLLSWLVLPFGMGLGSLGAWIAMSFTQAIQGMMAIIAFRQGAWKTKKV